VLAELRDYEPPRTVTYGAQAGYRYCHACHLVTPHEWPPVPQEEPRGDMKIIRWTCRLCLHWALPSAVLPADRSLPRDQCEKGIQHPASTRSSPSSTGSGRRSASSPSASSSYRRRGASRPAPTPAVPSQRQPIRPATMPALPADSTASGFFLW
jgi:hypothetical protein